MTRPDSRRVALLQTFFRLLDEMRPKENDLIRRSTAISKGTAQICALCLATLAVSGHRTFTLADELVVFAASETPHLNISADRAFKAVVRTVSILDKTQELFGTKFRLARVNDNCTSDTARKAAQGIVDKRPAVVIGHQCDIAAIAAARIYARHNVIFFATRTRHPDLTKKRAGPTIFRLAPRSDKQADAIARHLVRYSRNRKIAILHDRTAMMIKLANDIKKQTQRSASKRNTPPPHTKIYPFRPAAPEYERLAHNLISDDRKIVVFAAFPAEVEIISRQLIKQSADIELVGTETLLNADFFRTIEEHGLNLSLAVPTTSQARIFVKHLTGFGPSRRHKSNSAARAQFAINIWKDSVRRSRTFFSVAVAESLLKYTSSTSHSTRVFNDLGDANYAPSHEIIHYRHGKWTYR